MFCCCCFFAYLVIYLPQYFFFSTEFVNPLTIVPASQVAYIGNGTTFQCHYRDGSQDKVTWLKKGGSLPNGRHSVDNGVLTITEIELQDEGTYVCKVNTAERKITVEAYLDVQCKWLSLKPGRFPSSQTFWFKWIINKWKRYDQIKQKLSRTNGWPLEALREILFAGNFRFHFVVFLCLHCTIT